MGNQHAASAKAQASKYLATYLNDHLAGSTFALDLAKRAASENEGTELGAFLSVLALEIEADRRALQEIMSAFGVSTDPLKQVIAWVGEKAARLKPNGQLLGYSPLSPLIELETLLLGITGKLHLWHALDEAFGDDAIPVASLPELIARAEQQRADVERHRVEVSRRALTA
jgi:hypothetical protein